MRKITHNIFFLLFAATFFSGCSKDTLTGLFVGTDQEEQIVDREIQQEHFQIVTVFKGKHSLQDHYAHPILISPETVHSVMKDIRFQTREYPESIKLEKTEWSIPAPLFDEAELPALASGISRIFAQLTPKEEIYFYVDSKNKVEGKTYITSDGWYWYFRTINGKGPKDDLVSNVKEWKIHLNQGDNYLVTHTGYELKKINVNWISMPLPKDVYAEIQKKYQGGSEKDVDNYKLKREYSTDLQKQRQEVSQPERSQQDTEVIDRKIMILDKLKEDGIITEEEYKNKVQDVLRKEL